MGGDGEEFAGGKGGAEVFEEEEKVGVAGAEGFDVDLDAGEAGVCGEEGSGVFCKCVAPGFVGDQSGCAVWAANPWDDAEAFGGVEEALDLFGVDGGDVAGGRGGAEVREDVGDVVGAEFAEECGDGFRGAVFGELGGFVVCGEPRVVAEPSVCEPDAVGAFVMAAVGDF